jgi:cysteine desulfurase
VPAIVGFGAAAAELTADHRLSAEATTARAQTDRVVEAALAVDDVELLGDPTDRLPHLVCLSIGGVEAEPILLALDQRGISVHSGSSCSSEALEPSPVLTAMGVDADRSLRPSVGWSTVDADIDAFVAVFAEVVAKLRALRTG